MNKMPTVLITGAAGDIGRAIARSFAERGYRLLLVDINAPALTEFACGLQNSIAITANLADQAQLKRLIENVRSQYGHINVACINAGVIIPGDLTELSEQHIDLQLSVNLHSAIHLIKACAENMIENNGGHIISTVSMGGIVAMKGSASYSASKFGLRGFMTSIRDELKPKGVHVSGVFPTGVDTQQLRFEAENNGSPLNFIGSLQTAEQVAKTVMRALESKKLEYYVSYLDGLTGRFLSFFPWLLPRLYPLLEKIGERGRQDFLKEKGIS